MMPNAGPFDVFLWLLGGLTFGILSLLTLGFVGDWLWVRWMLFRNRKSVKP